MVLKLFQARAQSVIKRVIVALTRFHAYSHSKMLLDTTSISIEFSENL